MLAKSLDGKKPPLPPNGGTGDAAVDWRTASMSTRKNPVLWQARNILFVACRGSNNVKAACPINVPISEQGWPHRLRFRKRYKNEREYLARESMSRLKPRHSFIGNQNAQEVVGGLTGTESLLNRSAAAFDQTLPPDIRERCWSTSKSTSVPLSSGKNRLTRRQRTPVIQLCHGKFSARAGQSRETGRSLTPKLITSYQRKRVSGSRTTARRQKTRGKKGLKKRERPSGVDNKSSVRGTRRGRIAVSRQRKRRHVTRFAMETGQCREP